MDGQARVNVILELKNKLKTGMTQAKQYLNQNVQAMKGKLNELRETHVQAFSEMKNSIPGVGRALELIRSPLVLVTAAVIALAGAYSKASAMASQFNNSMLKSNVTGQENGADFRNTSAAVLSMAGNSKMRGAVQAAPDAYNILLSSGMEKATALATITPTLQAAKAGFTDVSITARAAAASMNSSGIKDATRIYDILFATLNKGNAEFADIANYLPKIIPAAKNVGISMEQTAGAFAYLTAQGQTSERAATLLENAFKVLADPDKVKKFKAIGVSIYDNDGRVKNLTDIVDGLNGALNGLTDEKRTKVLDSLGIDMEAAGAFSALSADAKSFRETIEFTTNSQGQLNKAIAASKSPMDSFVKMGNKLDAMWVDVGTNVNDTLGSIGEWLEPIADKVLPEIGSVLKGIWNTGSDILEVVFTIPKGVIEWASKSELVHDIWWLIKEVVSTVGDVIQVVAAELKNIYENTLKPIFEGIDGAYSSLKSIGQDFKNGYTDIKNEFNGTNARADDYREKLGRGEVSWETILRDLGPELAYRKFPEMAAGKSAYDNNYNDFIKGLKPNPTNLYNENGGGGGNDQVKKLLDNINNKKDKSTGISGGQQTRIITINKLSVVDGDFVSKSEEIAGMGKKEVERWFEEMMQRIIMGIGRSATT